MKKIIMFGLIFIFLLSFVYAADENVAEAGDGRAYYNDPSVDILNHFQKFLYNVGLKSVLPAASFVKPGDSQTFFIKEIAVDSCTDAQLSIKAYNPSGDKILGVTRLTSATPISTGERLSESWQYTIPSNAEAGQWRVYSWIWCNSKSKSLTAEGGLEVSTNVFNVIETTIIDTCPTSEQNEWLGTSWCNGDSIFQLYKDSNCLVISRERDTCASGEDCRSTSLGAKCVSASSEPDVSYSCYSINGEGCYTPSGSTCVGANDVIFDTAEECETYASGEGSFDAIIVTPELNNVFCLTSDGYTCYTPTLICLAGDTPYDSSEECISAASIDLNPPKIFDNIVNPSYVLNESKLKNKLGTSLRNALCGYEVVIDTAIFKVNKKEIVCPTGSECLPFSSLPEIAQDRLLKTEPDIKMLLPIVNTVEDAGVCVWEEDEFDMKQFYEDNKIIVWIIGGFLILMFLMPKR